MEVRQIEVFRGLESSEETQYAHVQQHEGEHLELADVSASLVVDEVRGRSNLHEEVLDRPMKESCDACPMIDREEAGNEASTPGR